LKPGQIVYWVSSRNSTNEPNRLIVSSIGCALPADPNQYGYLSEHHSFGETDSKAGEYAEDLAASMLATTLGIEFDPDIAWNEREQIYKMSGKIIRTTNITQSAIGNKDGLWTTVVAAAVFVDMKFASESLIGNQVHQIAESAEVDLPSRKHQVSENNNKQ